MISEEYVSQLRQVHSSRVWGASGYSHAPVIANYMQKLKAKSILDYGCGQATLRKSLLRLNPSAIVFEYDPAIIGKDKKPEPVDLLVANDVLEHIEFEYIDDTLKYLRSLALKGAYFTIDLYLSKVFLPDGRNAHLIIKSKDWWLQKLRESKFEILKAELRRSGLWVWAK